MPDRIAWTCDSTVIDHMTGDPEHVFNHQVPPLGQQLVTNGDGTVKRVLFVGTLNLTLHCATDVGVQLMRVFIVDGLAINLFSIHARSIRPELSSCEARALSPAGPQARLFVLQCFPPRTQ